MLHSYRGQSPLRKRKGAKEAAWRASRERVGPLRSMKRPLGELEGLWKKWVGLRARWEGLGARWESLRASKEAQGEEGG